MKKIYLAALTLAMTACVSNDDLNPVDNYGYIDVNVSNDPVMVTRAKIINPSNWIIKANDIDLNTVGYKVKKGDYTVTAQSHSSEDDALIQNDGWGEPFYSGSTANNEDEDKKTVTVSPGNTANAEVPCGKAKNGRVKVSFSLASNFTDYSVAVGTTDRSLDFSSETKDKLAYFKPGNINYTFSYKYNKTDVNTPVTGSITVVEGTEHEIKISSNDNGTIKVTITYDDTFNDGDDVELTFDAATGKKVETTLEGN